MSLNGAYDRDNVFAKILRGDMPATKVYEDDQVLAIMDVFPQSRGHTLVIPKVEARNLLDIDPAALQGLITRVQKVARAVEKALDPDGVTVMQFNGAAGGQTVFHLHFHIVPRWEGTAMGRHAEGMADQAELKALAKQISAAMA
ncbi:HIT family protein [Caulobacter sp. 17J65-9]|uniref:HIT family protein n=1 Tax=Caulobacter sp. 17J65-9 TaxID=2709382 RepID=UPI0013CB324A|nr:HIT family protein [Caulobacter sp. 17J65-9]NEX91349.1 HIT family protein [Caulobacter sp. 17J65-9]